MRIGQSDLSRWIGGSKRYGEIDAKIAAFLAKQDQNPPAARASALSAAADLAYHALLVQRLEAHKASKGVAWCLWSVPNEDAPGEREDAAESSSPRTRPHANADSDDSVILPPPPTPRSRHVDVGNVSEVGPADPQGDRSSNLQRGTHSEG